MALRTIGTNANNSLTGFVVGTNDVIAADVATMLTQLRMDAWQTPTGAIPGAATGQAATPRARINEAYIRQGKLVIPNRGWLVLRAGDFIGWNVTTGWPIVVSGDDAANGPWTHT